MTGGQAFPLRLQLDYMHGAGSLTPYFDALREGRALATACSSCGKAWCPPQLLCPEDGMQTIWRELSGAGSLVAATATTMTLPFRDEAADHVFGLIRLDGADNAMFARLGVPIEAAHKGLRVRLAVTPGDAPHPAQSAWFVPIEVIP